MTPKQFAALVLRGMGFNCKEVGPFISANLARTYEITNAALAKIN